MASLVQVLSPKTHRYVLIDRSRGVIVKHKKSAGPYKGVEVVGVPRSPLPIENK